MASPYLLLHEKKVKPVTASSITSSKTNKRWWNRESKVKPVVAKPKVDPAEYYKKTGIIWNGSDESSVIHSLF